MPIWVETQNGRIVEVYAVQLPEEETVKDKPTGRFSIFSCGGVIPGWRLGTYETRERAMDAFLDLKNWIIEKHPSFRMP